MGINEEVICKIYEFNHNVKIFGRGCIPIIIKHFGASPDGIVEPNGINKIVGRMLELNVLYQDLLGLFLNIIMRIQGQLEDVILNIVIL